MAFRKLRNSGPGRVAQAVATGVSAGKAKYRALSAKEEERLRARERQAAAQEEGAQRVAEKDAGRAGGSLAARVEGMLGELSKQVAIPAEIKNNSAQFCRNFASALEQSFTKRQVPVQALNDNNIVGAIAGSLFATLAEASKSNAAEVAQVLHNKEAFTQLVDQVAGAVIQQAQRQK